jgi:LuxR family quorum-sensing system transcriptional regulator SinR
MVGKSIFTARGAKGQGMPSLDDIDPKRILFLEANLTPNSFDELVEFIRHHYSLVSISYMCSAFQGRHPSDPFLSLTYGDAAADPEWRKGADPVQKLGARSVDPLDWATLRGVEKKVRRLFNDAPEVGARVQGLTVPVRGPTPEISALFSVTTHDTDAEWTARRYDLMRDMVQVAHFVHQKAYELHISGNAIDSSTVDLESFTPREIEALQWAAEGLQPEDIGFAMRISVETVKAYLESARYKLKALNRTHAVSKAIRAGLFR